MRILHHALCLLLIAAAGLAAGCDQKEKVLDVETPEGGVEVERDKESGEIDINVDE